MAFIQHVSVSPDTCLTRHYKSSFYDLIILLPAGIFIFVWHSVILVAIRMELPYELPLERVCSRAYRSRYVPRVDWLESSTYQPWPCPIPIKGRKGRKQTLREQILQSNCFLDVRQA